MTAGDHTLKLANAFTVGLMSGSRSMSRPAVASRTAAADKACGGGRVTSCGKVAMVLGIFAVGELLADKLPFLPDRRKAPSFALRVASGAFSAGAMNRARGDLPLALLAGAIGAVAGTLGGSALRSTLSKAFGRDLPAALIEDAVVAVLALIVLRNSSGNPENALPYA